MSDAGPQTPEMDAAAPAEPSLPGRRYGVVAAALAAALASAGLAWWLSAPDQGKLSVPTPPAAVQAAQPKVQLASATADAAQVQRAYEQVQTVYAELGFDGLLRFAQTCEEALAKDARVLDFCLAFDMFAAALTPDDQVARVWAESGEARRLRLAQAALPPGADPQARLAELDRLMRQATGAADVRPVRDVRPARPAAKLQTAAAEKAGRQKLAAAKRKIQLAVARAPARTAAARKPAAKLDPCRLESTPADRILCANPELKAADQRLQRAYVAALAAGADPEQLDREQADWRRARNAAGTADDVAALYARRIEDLDREANPLQ